MGPDILRVGVFIGAVYLAVVFAFLVRQFLRRTRPLFTRFSIVIYLVHWMIVTLYLASFCVETALSGWLILTMALALQAGGIFYVRKMVVNDPARRERCIKGLVAAPLMLFGALIVVVQIAALNDSAPALLSVLAILFISVMVLIVTWKK